jgi:uncharacterized protein
MATLLEEDRAPSEVMQLVARADRAQAALLASAGRNDPCPRGSGRKYKHCHGATD